MLFNSYGFIFIFLPVVLFSFFILARIQQTYAAAWLAISSLFFYGYWNPTYVGLLLGSIACNYTFGRWISKADAQGASVQKKRVLILSISANLLLLAYFKYANFFLSNINSFFGEDLSLGNIILPLGISFFTFTQIAYLADAFQGRVKEYNFVHFVLFVTYFPHLIAGPVLHHKEMMPQFAQASTYRINWNNIATGLILLSVGLCKKVLWADSLAPFANAIFDRSNESLATGILPTIYEAWAGALAYTLQIYFDFSGYTDMALGLALMFNIRLPINFNSPYKATSIIEFWRCWHITLSTFLRDYLYIPLGGNRNGRMRRHVNLIATMLLGGLWHGAGWTFVVWGGLHGAYLTINHLWRGIFPERIFGWVPKWLGVLTGGALTFVAVASAWVIFRSNDVAQSATLLKAMFGIEFRPISLHAVMHGKLLVQSGMSGSELATLVISGLLWVWLLPNSTRIRFIDGKLYLTLLQIVVVMALLCFSINQFGSYSPFLYFQF